MYIIKTHFKTKGKKMVPGILKCKFELIEMTGITRTKAANVVARYLNGIIENYYNYDTHKSQHMMKDCNIVSDSSIIPQKLDGEKSQQVQVTVELVSPILSYKEDIDTLQEIIEH